MTPYLGLWLISFSIKYQTHSVAVVGNRAWLGTWPLHTQRAFGGGSQFNDWSASQKRESWLVGEVGAARFRPARSLASALGPGPIPKGGAVWADLAMDAMYPGSAGCPACGGQKAGLRVLVSLGCCFLVCNKGTVVILALSLPQGSWEEAARGTKTADRLLGTRACHGRCRLPPPPLAQHTVALQGANKGASRPSCCCPQYAHEAVRAGWGPVHVTGWALPQPPL